MNYSLPLLLFFLTACGPSPAESDTAPNPLTTGLPDAERGKVLFSERGDAHCVLCHEHQGTDVPFQGNLGPDLTLVAQRLSEGQIRLRIMDYDRIKPGTTMPPYFRTKDLHQLPADKSAQTVLTAQEIEDITAFLIFYETN